MRITGRLVKVAHRLFHSLEVMPGLALVIMTMTMTKKGGRKSGLTFLVREIDFFWQGVVSQS